MLVELALISGASLAYLKHDEWIIKRKWEQVMYSGSWFTNRLGKTIKILELDKTAHGWDIKIEFPYSYTADDLEKDLPILKEAFLFENIETDYHGNIATMRCIVKKEFSTFAPHPLPPYKVLICDGLLGPVIVDLNKYPHILIGGDTGTGKTRLLFCILSNLIATTNQAEIHLMQIRKSDLEVFADCRQVISVSKSLQEIRDNLKLVDEECQRREPLISPSKGIYSIEDYNKANPNKKLKYVFVTIEEFSTINRSGGDTKEEDTIKKQCLKYIKTIVNVGRSSGIFLITALQKPTNDSIPSDIKSQLTTRVSLRIDDDQPAIVIMGNNKPTGLAERQVMVRTLGRKIGYTYTIDHDEITAAIKDSVIAKPARSIPPKKIKSGLGKIGEILNEAD